MSRSVALRLVAIAVSSAVALGVAELAVRAMPPSALGFEFQNDHFIPPREFAKDTTFNRLRVHDREPKPKLPGVRRVLLLGDSYVAAMSVPIPEGVARRLEHHLSARSELGAVDVVSLSKEGWGQREELVALKRRGRQLAPDLVVLLFTARNDLYNNATQLPEKHRAQRLLEQAREERLPMPQLIPADKATALWLPGSALNRLISHRLSLAAARKTTPVPAQFYSFAPARREAWASAWQETGDLLSRLRREARSLGAGFAVASGSTPEGVLDPAAGAARLRAAHPEFAETEFDIDFVDRELAKLCNEKSIPFTALQPALRQRQRESGEPLHWRYDGHWNGAGNDAAAEFLADFVAEQLGTPD